MVQTSSTMTPAGAFAAKALDAAAGAVGFFGLAHEEAVKQRRGGMRLRAPGARGRDIRNDGVGAHGEAADGFRVDLVGFKQLEDGMAGKPAAFSMEGGGAAVDVVVACAA